MKLKPRILTILFTENCPLNCIYCNLKCNESYGKGTDIGLEAMIEQIDEFVKYHSPQVSSRVVLTGGEPLAFWDRIVTILETYGRLGLEFELNTSGFLLTEEKIKYLSKFRVSFNLSVDGDTKLTNYLRPLANNSYSTTYFEEFKKVIPTLLYYFPDTPWKSVITRHTIDQLYKQYLAAERHGFRNITFIPDIMEMQGIEREGCWSLQDYDKLNQQFKMIGHEILIGFERGYMRPIPSEFYLAMYYGLNNGPADIYKISCGVLSERRLSTMYQADDKYYKCLYRTEEDTYEEVAKRVQASYDEKEGKCPHNATCPWFKFCCMQGCIKDSFDVTGDYFTRSFDTCNLAKIVNQNAATILTYAQKHFPNSAPFQELVGKLLKGGM